MAALPQGPFCVGFAAESENLADYAQAKSAPSTWMTAIVRNRSLDVLRRHIEGVKPLQASSGMWRQVMDHPELWEETSCTAMFAYSIARAVNRADIVRGAEELGLPLDEVITNVIAALRADASRLGLAGAA